MLPVWSIHANTASVCVPGATFGKDHITVPVGKHATHTEALLGLRLGWRRCRQPTVSAAPPAAGFQCRAEPT